MALASPAKKWSNIVTKSIERQYNEKLALPLSLQLQMNYIFIREEGVIAQRVTC
jgi:hypothetical protein